MSIKENMEEHTNNWDELIKRRAITDLFKIIRECNNEIEQVTDKCHAILQSAINDLNCNTRYTSEQSMLLEAALYQCDQYFSSDTSVSLEKSLAKAIVPETELVVTEFITDIADQTLHYEYDEGTKLALELIASYSEALKMKVLDSASNNMLDREE